jgi:hypothetical protein
MNVFKKVVIFSAVLFCCVGAGSAQPQPLTYWNFSESGYNEIILGIDPSIAATSTVTVELVPIKIVFPDGTSLDPTLPTCSSGSSALQLIANSPIFQSAPFSAGGQDLGTTQFIDAYQHANFWSSISPGNHLMFDYRIYGSTDPAHVPNQVLTLTTSDGHATGTGCSAAGVVNLAAVNTFINGIFQYLPANTIPVFVIYNTLINASSNTSPAYEGGFHNFNGIGGYPYVVSTFIDNHSIFQGITPPPVNADGEDVYSISHELAEVAVNPRNSNLSPLWGNTGQVKGCTAGLEVADPLTGKGFTKSLNGFNYHLPDLAFISWFMREQPSTALNFLYTFTGNTLYTPSSCPNAQRRRQRWDLNGDQTSDVLMVDSTASKMLGIWFMNDHTIASGRAIGPVNGRSIATGDFDGDGLSDILLRDENTGDLSVWLMNGAQIRAESGFIGSPGSSFKVAGTGDFNGDGKDDILLRDDATGNVFLWLMNGRTIATTSFVGSPGILYTVVGVADFNGDGKADVLLRYVNNDLGMWFMNGSAIIAGGFVGNLTSDYSIEGIGDFNGDGKADILLQDILGEIGVWLMDGATVASGALVTSDTVYTVAALGDYNRDGKTDILLRAKSNGSVGMLLMDGSTIISGSSISLLPWSSYTIIR